MSRSDYAGWDLIQAPSHGDRHAFNEICDELRAPVMHAVERQLELEAQHCHGWASGRCHRTRLRNCFQGTERKAARLVHVRLDALAGDTRAGS